MARRDEVWERRAGGYIEVIEPLGLDILNKGTNRYLNFNTLVGSTGYGFRDNNGVMEVKNASGAWATIGVAGDSVAWGAITGALSSQTDLTNALNLKAPLASPAFTGVASFADGAVSAPSIAFTTDPTTGIYHTGTGATGAILAAVNGVNVLTMLAGGNVGIGTIAFGTSASKCLALTNTATAPSNSANLAHLYSADADANGAALAIWQENAPYAGISVASTTKIPVVVNGTTYYLLATTVA